MAEGTKDTDELHGFYEHLGSLVIGGRDGLHEENDKDWISVLSRSGFHDLADRYENLLLTAESDALYTEGLLLLISTTGRRLRAATCQPRSEQDIVRMGEAAEREAMPPPRALGAPDSGDVSVLSHILIAGSLDQKRAAAEALGNFLLRKKDPRSRMLVQEAASILDANRDPEVAFEVTHALAFAMGSEGKRAKNDLARASRFMARIHRNIVNYWDGLLESEPVGALSSGDLVTLGMWMRLASDYTAGHVGEILIDLLAQRDDRQVSSMVAAFIYSADRRLLPVLIRILQDGGLAAKIEAIKAVAHIDDPRSYGALGKAYRHTTDPFEKIVLARALARMGSRYHADDLSRILRTEANPDVLEEAIKAAADLEGAGDDIRAMVRARLESENPAIMKAAIRALSRLGTEDDIETLGRIAERHPKARALVKAATQTLYSSIVLEGSEPRSREPLQPLEREARQKSGLRSRIVAALFYVAAFFELVFKRFDRSLAWIDGALARDPLAPRNHFLKAYVYYSMGRPDLAIETYRTAVSVDASYTIEKPVHADRLIRAYLARSLEIDAELGAPDEALVLLGELDDIDLRLADPNLKIEIGRRIDDLRFARRRGEEAEE